MKKLLTFIFCSMAALASRGQTVTATVGTAPCAGDGVVNISTSGLTPPLTITYYGGITPITHSGVMTTTDVLSGWGGQALYIYAVGGGTASTIVPAAPPLTYSVTTTAAACPALGTATATVTGGLAPYTYTWTNTSTSAVTTGNPASVTAGDYDLMVTDANGCQYGALYAPDSIYVYSIPAFSITSTTTVASCTNGTATISTVSGGLPPYSYLWNTGATSSSISGLTMGGYNCVVTDANGCSETDYMEVLQSVTISAPVTPTPATCTAADGAVIAFGSGGMPPYSYLWSNGATTQSQGGLGSGYYSVVVTDANGCIGNGGASVSASTPITATYASTASSCTSPTGSSTLTIVGGTTPYTINWDTYPLQTGVTASALPAGTYGFHITDAVGCVRNGAAVINPVSIISLGMSSTSATCTMANGSASVSASGGTAPYTYLWSGGGTSSSITSVPAGYYNVSVTDAAGCHSTGYTHVSSSSPVTIALGSTSPSCIYSADGSLTATPFGGTSPYTYSWNTGGTGSSISGLGAGYYSVHVSDAMGCVANRWVNLAAGSGTACYCTIQGTVYYDANGNCIQDSGEPGIEGIQIHCAGFGYTYTDASGHYSFRVPSGSYTISETVQTFYPLSACQLNNIAYTAVASSGCTTTINFANGMNTIHDIHVSTWDYNFAVPGNVYHQKTIIKNEGTVTESTMLAGYMSDGQLLAPSFVPGAIFAGAPYWYSASTTLATLSPGQSSTFIMNYNVPTDIPLGTTVLTKDSAVYAAPMSSWTSDYTPWNNVNYFNTTVIGSYDPNFKEVNPKGTGPEGYISTRDSVMEYMVHFQNTGTYYAEKVVVIDTLDANLDWSTLHPVYQSHQCVVTMSENGVATFTFDNIHLPSQSMNDINSNGMFTYTIKQKPALAIGTQIRNKASIYFDYNAPIVTNTTLNTIGSTVGIANTAGNAASFGLYPNPADKTCFAVINSDVFGSANIQVSDISGKVLVNNTVAVTIGKQSVPVDVSALAPGMYLVTLHNMGKTETQKLVIMK